MAFLRKADKFWGQSPDSCDHAWTFPFTDSKKQNKNSTPESCVFCACVVFSLLLSANLKDKH